MNISMESLREGENMTIKEAREIFNHNKRVTRKIDIISQVSLRGELGGL